jgi:hypothetical protein
MHTRSCKLLSVRQGATLPGPRPSQRHRDRGHTASVVPRAAQDDADTPAERIRRYKDILTKEYGISLPTSEYDRQAGTCPADSLLPDLMHLFTLWGAVAGSAYGDEAEQPALSTSYSVTESSAGRMAARYSSPQTEPTARVQFSIAVHINYGSTIRVIGSHPLLGRAPHPVMLWQQRPECTHCSGLTPPFLCQGPG